MRRPARPRLAPTLLAFGSLFVLLAGSGCVTRLSRESFLDGNRIQVDLVREVKGFTTQKKGFEHPAIVSAERLVNVLNAVEIEEPEKGGGIVRQPAFHPEIVGEVAQALSNAFAEVGPDQEVSILAVRKEMRLGILHRKFLTSFLAHMKDGHLYLHLSRVEWPIPRDRDRLPKPRRDREPMDFRLVSGDLLYYFGPQEPEIAWQDPTFRQAYRLPGSTGGERRRREVLEEAPMTQRERKQLLDEEDPVGSLDPEQLRALADLEEDRRAGRITEAAYQRARRQLLRSR